MNSKLKLINKITSALPQLQCKKCGYEDCVSYASAVVNQKEDLNKCEPGQQKTELQLKNIIQGIEKISLNKIQNYQIATINEIGTEERPLIGHNNQCNGCELCISQCPVDCMTMIDNPMELSWSWPSTQANKSKDDYNNRLTRIEIIKNQKKYNKKISHDESSIQDYIKNAIKREERKYKKIKEYG